MSLDDGDKAIVREIAFEVAGVLKEELTDGFKTQIELHTSRCPAVEAVKQWPKEAKSFSKGFIIGLVLGGIALGTGTSLLIAKLLHLAL